MKKLLNFIILSSVALLFNGCISGWGWLVPYNLQPSYHKFKKMCKLNNYPKSEEKYNRILAYFDKSLDGSIGKNGYAKIGYSNRLDLGVYIYYKNPNNKTLTFKNIDKMYFRPIWKNYAPNIYGNEGNMDFRLKFDGEIDCRSLVGELDG